jgi:hypothetical protein
MPGGPSMKFKIFLCCAGILATAIILHAMQNIKAAERDSTAAAPKADIAMQNDKPDKENQKFTPIVIPTLTRFGFEPRSFTVPDGKYLLLVRNKSGIEDVEFQLQIKDGPIEAKEKPIKGKKFFEKSLNLRPGEYILGESSHKDWTCSITVMPANK